MMEGISTLKMTSASLSTPAPAASQGLRRGASPPAKSQINAAETSSTGSAEIGQVREIAEQINDQLQQTDGKFSVSVDDESGMVIVRITDSNTGEVVKQIPPQQIVDANVSVDKIIGLLVNDQA